MFRSDALLWYNVGDWSELGLAVPNFGDDTKGQNSSIHELTQLMGRNLQAVMFHPDALLRTPPSINTLTRIHKLCTRARSLLAGRAVPPGRPNMEPAHTIPAAEEFLIYPCPYFKVRNSWLKGYAGLILLAVTEAFQHQENARPIEISTDFAGLIGQYVQRVYRTMAVELFRIPLEQAMDPAFTLTDEQLGAYNPGAWFTSTEMIDTVPRLDQVPTEDDLRILTDGIPVSRLPQLGPWPAGAGDVAGRPARSAAGSGDSFLPGPGA